MSSKTKPFFIYFYNLEKPKLQFHINILRLGFHLYENNMYLCQNY